MLRVGAPAPTRTAPQLPALGVWGLSPSTTRKPPCLSFSRSCYCCCCWVTSVVSDSVWPHRRQPMRLPCPWDSPGKSTGVGCHFLLQCRKEKSESEVTQSCPTLSDPMDCSSPGSSVHGIFQARVLEWGAIAFSEVVTSSVETLCNHYPECSFCHPSCVFILLQHKYMCINYSA